MKSPNSYIRLDWLLLAQCVIGLTILFSLGSMRDVVLRFAPDDAFYYFQIARNWAGGIPSSFDGLTLTNGYHPLWQWLLIPLAAMIHDPHFLARTSVIVCLWMYAAAALAAQYALKPGANPHLWFTPVWTAFVLLFSPVYGMEGPLCVLLFSLLLWQALRFDERSIVQALSLGLSTGLLGLARIDHLLWALALDLWLVWRWRRGKLSLTVLLAAAAPQILLVGGYFLSNLLVWGHALPVSASIKMARSGLFSLAIPYSFLYLVSLLSLPLSAWAAWRGGRLAWVGAGNILYILMVLKRGGLETWDWYFALPVFTVGVLLPVFMNETQWVKTRWRQPLLAVLALAAFTQTSGEIVSNRSEFIAAYDNALALAELPENEYTFADSDCGILGFFSRQRWLNMDGLTLDFSFQQALRDDTLPQWLREHGLNAYVDFDQEPFPETVILYSWPGIGYHHDEAILHLEPLRPLGNGRMLMKVVEISE